MLKKALISSAALALMLILPGSARANSDGLGLGFIAGEPTGVSGKLWMGRSTALDMAVAWSSSGDDNDDLHLQADHVWHDFGLLSVDEGRLPVYYGLGARVRFDDRAGDDSFGVRFPVGLAYLFQGNKVDLFGEVVPTLEVTPDTDVDIEGGIGLRYFFH
jgi:hypothetical protein